MIVTTTNSVEGYSIRQSLGVVNANVVIGTNLFSDIAASLTDVFGGRSDSYKSKLTTIYDEVMKELIGKAENYHADAIVGLHVDFDEVSGGGKSMFMVSASGTAVCIERTQTDRYFVYRLIEQLINYKEKGILSQEEFEYEKDKVIKQYNNPILSDYERFKIQQKEKEEKEIKRKKEIEERIELLKKEKEKYIKEASKILNTQTSTMDDISEIDENTILTASYDNIPFDSSDSMQYVIAKFIRLNRIPEACKYYIDETGLEDIASAIDFCLNIQKQVENVNENELAELLPKLKNLKKQGFTVQAISEYQKLTITDKKTAEAFILSLEE
ncbi:YbjQ family protein [uncultured Bacteroides sp.]|uniref:YbjQ family protein n=1 Tax=uncultured Bacteroides sp. TaxID=162156 RepID=UPI002622CF6D|nr:YbjQ family protein [uncultured Bacteroides sp.]